MKKKSPKLIVASAAVLALANIFSLTGCGKTENTNAHTNQEVQLDVSETEQEITSAHTDVDAAQIQDGEQGAETGGAIRTYSDAGNRKTQAQWDEEIRAERAGLEAKVKAAGGISEKKAVEIAQKALETDLGEKAKELKLVINETYGWSSDLCVADWSEIKEKDKGALAYSIGFNNVKDGIEMDDLLNYVCTVNAVDGSILEAYTIQGWGDATVRYEH